MTPTGRHQHKGGEQGDLILRQVHRTQVFPKLEDGADQVVTACHSKGHRERASDEEDQRTTFTLDLYWERGTQGGGRKGEGAGGVGGEREKKRSGTLTAHGSVLSKTGDAFTEFLPPRRVTFGSWVALRKAKMRSLLRLLVKSIIQDGKRQAHAAAARAAHHSASLTADTPAQDGGGTEAGNKIHMLAR